MAELEGLSEVTHSVVARSCHFLVEQRGEHLGAVRGCSPGEELSGQGGATLASKGERKLHRDA